MTLEIWDIAADRLRKTLGHNNFKSWIEPLQFISENSGIAEFSVPTSFFGNYVRQHFEDQILYQVRKSGLQVSRLVFTVERCWSEISELDSPHVLSQVNLRESKARLDCALYV